MPYRVLEFLWLRNFITDYNLVNSKLERDFSAMVYLRGFQNF